MQSSLLFIRIFFITLSTFLTTTYAIAGSSDDNYYLSLGLGIFGGLFLGCVLIALDLIFKRFNLRAFNITTIGLFLGYLMGEAVLHIFQGVFNGGIFTLSPATTTLIQMGIFLFSIYLGLVMTLRASDDFSISIPFIGFKADNQKKKDLVVDSSALSDPRLIDLASSGLLDNNLIIPRFVLKELFDNALEGNEESVRVRARKCIETTKRLESMPTLEMRYAESDYPEMKDPMSKLIRLARQCSAHILTADSNRLQQSSIEEIRLINLHTLSTALKPLAQAGECLNIKIQRYGTEPRQGVGYLDDGTMVVVNGGAEFIGETIRAQVLSVKHTASGRMVFCNALEEGVIGDADFTGIGSECATTAKSFLAYETT